MGTSYNVAQRQRPDVPSERREVRQCYGTDFELFLRFMEAGASQPNSWFVQL